jgi:N-acetylglucosamine malate deacetylase 1
MDRRQILKSAGLLAGTAVAHTIRQDVPNDPKFRRSKIVVTGGHPGDPEYACGGTIARLATLGHEVVLLYLNDGAWQQTSAATRIAEAKKACEILKARPAWADQVNGHAVVDNSHYAAFQKILELESPDAVITHWLIDNHPDHRAVANLTFEAWNRSKRRFAL